MGKIKNVLIVLDYDPTSINVADDGKALAKIMKAEVILFHVLSDPLYTSLTTNSPKKGFTSDPDKDTSLRNNVDERMKEAQLFLDQVKLHLGDTTIQTIVTDGDYADCVVNTAKDLHSEVVVMGSHSRRWLEEIVKGRVTEKIIKHTSTPLFIVPNNKHIG